MPDAIVFVKRSFYYAVLHDSPEQSEGWTLDRTHSHVLHSRIPKSKTRTRLKSTSELPGRFRKMPRNIQNSPNAAQQQRRLLLATTVPGTWYLVLPGLPHPSAAFHLYTNTMAPWNHHGTAKAKDTIVKANQIGRRLQHLKVGLIEYAGMTSLWHVFL